MSCFLSLLPRCVLAVLYTTCFRAAHSSSGVELSFSSDWTRTLSISCSKLFCGWWYLLCFCQLLSVAFLSALWRYLFDSNTHSGLPSFSFRFATPEERVFQVVETSILWEPWQRCRCYIWQVPLLLVQYVFLVGQLLLGRGESWRPIAQLSSSSSS